MKCLEKDRARRYESASLLAMDIGHHLRHEPVLASPPSMLYRARKFVRRHRTPVLAGVAVVLALALGLAGALVGLTNASRERNRAQALLRQMDLKHAQELFETDRAAEGLANLALLVREMPGDLPVVEWLLNEMTQRSFPLPLIEPLRHSDHVLWAQFSPDGSRILTTLRNNTAQVWDAAAGRALTPSLVHDPSLVPKDAFLEGLHPIFARFSPDGTRIVTGAIDGKAQLWDTATGRKLTPPLPHPDWVSYVAFSPDGKLVATACKDGAIRLWNAFTGEAVGKPFRHAVWANFAEFSPDGQRILTGSDDKTAQVWEVVSGARLGQPLRHEDELKYGEFSPDGERVVTASSDRTARVWNATTGQPLSPPLKHTGTVCSARFSPDAGRVVTASFDKTARVWDSFSGEALGKPMLHKSYVRSARFSRDGARVVTASEDGTARIWDAYTGEPLSEPMLHDGHVWSAEFDRTGRRVLTASADGTARVWDARPGQALHHSVWTGGALREALWSADGSKILVGHGTRLELWEAFMGRGPNCPWDYLDETFSMSVNFAPDGQCFVTASGDGTARIWPTGSRYMLTRPLRHRGRVHYAEFSADNQRVVTASADRTARVWSAATGEPLGPPLEHRDIVFMARFSPDGGSVVTASADGTAALWDARNGRPLRPPLPHPDQVTRAGFSPNGRLVATVCKDMAARVWDPASGRLLWLVRHLGPINCAAFSPDGRWLLTASDDRTARLRDARTGRPVAQPLAHNGQVLWAEFSADGQRVLTACEDGTARLWDARTGQWISEPFRHVKRVAAAHFHPQGNRVLTASADWTARVWEIVRARTMAPTWLPLLAECAAGQRLDPNRNLEPVAPAEWFKWRRQLSMNRPKPEGFGLRQSPAAFERPVNAESARGLAQSKTQAPQENPPEDAYARWAKWFCADRLARPTAPSSANRTEDFLAAISGGEGAWPSARERFGEALRLGGATDGLHLRWLNLWEPTQGAPSPRELAEMEWHSRQLSDPGLAAVAKVWYWFHKGDAQRAAAALDKARAEAGNSSHGVRHAWGRVLFRAGLVDEGLRVLAQAAEEAKKAGDADSALNYSWERYQKLIEYGRSAEAQAEWLPPSSAPPRPADAPPDLVDLTRFYNGELEGWFGASHYGAGLIDLPQGITQAGGTTFDIRNLVQLDSSRRTEMVSHFPGQCAGIPVHRSCRLLHFLHAVDEAEDNGVKVGAYRIHYADGQQAELPIIYGQDVLAWIDDSGATNAPRPTPVWQVRKPPGITVRLFKSTWTNPRPEVAISTLDFISTMTRAGPLLVAVTAEP
jgi:WD40 repeat protein